MLAPFLKVRKFNRFISGYLTNRYFRCLSIENLQLIYVQKYYIGFYSLWLKFSVLPLVLTWKIACLFDLTYQKQYYNEKFDLGL